MSVPEATVDYSGYCVSITGLPLATKAVTLKRADTSAVVAETTTDGQGFWKFDDIAASPLVYAEINSGVGSPPQMAIKRCYSGDVFSLYVREKLTASPTAIVSFPTAANVYLAGQPIDARYLNASGDTISGNLTVTGNLVVSGNATVDTSLTAAILNGSSIRRGGEDVWGPDNDGPDSGLNADRLDGQDAGLFARVASGAYSGTNGVNGHIATTFRPKLVIIHGFGGSFTEAYTVVDDGGSSRTISHDDINPYHIHGFEIAVAITSTPSTGFLVNINSTGAANHTGAAYWWVAIGAG